MRKRTILGLRGAIYLGMVIGNGLGHFVDYRESLRYQEIPIMTKSLEKPAKSMQIVN